MKALGARFPAMLRPALCGILLVVLAGCTSSHHPENALASSRWLDDERKLLEVTVGVYDDRWVSTPCDCRIEVDVGGRPVGAWDVTPNDFRGDGNLTWRGTIEGSLVEDCAEFEPFKSLTTRIILPGKELTATWFVGCKGA
jgi:hypothetical protein